MTSGGPFSGNKTAMPDHTMLAAIIPGPEGAVFLKLTGANEAVAKVEESFLEMVASPFDE